MENGIFTRGDEVKFLDNKSELRHGIIEEVNEASGIYRVRTEKGTLYNVPIESEVFYNDEDIQEDIEKSEEPLTSPNMLHRILRLAFPIIIGLFIIFVVIAGFYSHKKDTTPVSPKMQATIELNQLNIRKTELIEKKSSIDSELNSIKNEINKKIIFINK